MSQPPDHSPHDQFLRLYAEHEGALHTFVRSMLPTREEASEVMQEVIVILWQKFSQVDDFRPWAFGVARIAALRHLERRSRDRHVFDSELVSQLADESTAMSERHSDLEPSSFCDCDVVPIDVSDDIANHQDGQ